MHRPAAPHRSFRLRLPGLGRPLPRPLLAGLPLSATVGLMALAALTVLPALPVFPAAAAAQEGDGRDASADTVVTPLTPLTVTVLRDEIGTHRVPYAVSVLDREALRQGTSGAFLEDALGMLPGVEVQNRHNYAVGERLSVRGFGARTQFGIRGVRVVVDGIPATLPDGQSSLDHLDLSTLGAAEVLRGPGSALYGNAAGGVLLFRTEEPEPGGLRPEWRLVGGSDGLLNTTLSTSGRAGDLGLVAAVSRLEYDGFRADPTAPGETYGEADRWLVNARASHPAGPGLLRVTVNAVTLDAENPGSLARDVLDDAGDEPPAFGFNVAQRTGKEVDQAQLGVTWDAPLTSGPSAPRLETAAWTIRRSVVNPIPPSIIDLDRLAGGGRILVHGGAIGDTPLLWTVGGEIEVQSDDRLNFENDGGEAGALTLDQDETVLGTGAFARLGAALGDAVQVSGALRWDRIRFEADDAFHGPGFGGDPDDSGSRTLHDWSPSVGVLAELAPEATLWANLSTSFETPTTTELANRPDGAGGFNPELEPRTTRGIEVGARGRLGDRVGYELAWFRDEVDDELVPFEVPSAPGRSFFRNAGEARHEGFEAVMAAELAPGLDTRLVWSRTDARFVTYEVDGQDLSGNRVPGLAADRVAGRLSGGGERWFATLEAEWVGEVPVNDTNTEAADAYTLVGFRAGLREIHLGAVRAEPFVGVGNVLDETYVSSVAVNAFGGRYYEPGPGRTVYVGLSAGVR